MNTGLWLKPWKWLALRMPRCAAMLQPTHSTAALDNLCKDLKKWSKDDESNLDFSL